MKQIGKLLFLCFFAFSTLAYGVAKEEKKLALLIANNDYAKDLGKLSEPIKEAEALKKALESIGFEVILVTNVNKTGMRRALKNFKEKNDGGIAFFHYGGHAISVGGKNYLIPLETKVEDEEDLEDECLSVDVLMRSMQGSSNIVVLDSCRNNPFSTSKHRGASTRGLQAVVAQPQNSIIVYSAQAGSVAIDGVFTPILTKKIVQEGKSFSDILIEIRNEVKIKTNDKQRPGEYRELSSQVYLAGLPKNEPIPAYSSKPSVKTELKQGSLEVSTISPCSIFMEGIEVASLKAFAECNISCDVGMKDIEMKYKDGYVEKKSVVINKEKEAFVEGEHVSQDVADACYALGKEEKDEREALKWYKRAADAGNLDAMNDVGYYYQYGLGDLRKDEVEALKWYRVAADAGHATAMNNVGYYYQYGLGGLRKDEVEALKWLRKAADGGNAMAMCDIGYYYENGLGGLKENEKEALKWYRMAADGGNAIAMYNIGNSYAYGRLGLKEDEKEALKWYRMAADGGDADAMRNVADYYEDGLGGLKENEIEALKWYMKAADAGDPSAMNSVGYYYEYGLGGLKKDEKEALKWYRKAADAGNASAMYNIGICYEYGTSGLKRNKKEAIKWYRMARDAGDEDAIERLKTLE